MKCIKKNCLECIGPFFMNDRDIYDGYCFRCEPGFAIRQDTGMDSRCDTVFPPCIDQGHAISMDWWKVRPCYACEVGYYL